MAKTITAGVYGILCLRSRKFYIGSSANVERRLREHRANLQGNKHELPRLQKDWNNIGADAFAFVLFICPPTKPRFRYETHLIETLETLEHQQGYNKMIGDRWGVEASIRNTEDKLIRARKFQRLPNVPAETPMTPTYIATLQR